MAERSQASRVAETVVTCDPQLGLERINHRESLIERIQNKSIPLPTQTSLGTESDPSFRKLTLWAGHGSGSKQSQLTERGPDLTHVKVMLYV